MNPPRRSNQLSDESLSDKIRKHIEKELSEGLNFKEPATRTASIKRFEENYPEEKKSSISAIHGKTLAALAKANNENPAEFKNKKKIKPVYDTGLNANIKHAPVDAPVVRNPNAPGGPNWEDGKAPPGPGGAPAPAPVLTPEATGTIFATGYGFLQLFIKNLPDLTEKQEDDLGTVWHLPLSSKVSTMRGYTVMAIGTTIGIVGKNIKIARALSKKDKEKEKLVPFTQPNKAPAAPAEPETKTETDKELLKTYGNVPPA